MFLIICWGCLLSAFSSKALPIFMLRSWSFTVCLISCRLSLLDALCCIFTAVFELLLFLWRFFFFVALCLSVGVSVISPLFFFGASLLLSWLPFVAVWHVLAWLSMLFYVVYFLVLGSFRAWFRPFFILACFCIGLS